MYMNNALGNQDCPALMSDGRFATDYRPNCYVNNLINTQNELKNSNQQRIFLQRNANKLRELNTNYFVQKANCDSCNYVHVDPNGNDKYWDAYKSWLGYDGKK